MEIVDEVDKIDDMRKLARSKWEERMKKAGIDFREQKTEPVDEKQTRNDASDSKNDQTAASKNAEKS